MSMKNELLIIWLTLNSSISTKNTNTIFISVYSADTSSAGESKQRNTNTFY